MLISAISVTTLSGCQHPQGHSPDTAAHTASKEKKDFRDVYQPAEDLGVLFHDVQLARVYDDGKLFVDAAPKKEPALIAAHYLRNRTSADFDLKRFVEEHFSLPVTQPTLARQSQTDMTDHIESLWPELERAGGKADAVRYSSLIPLPYPYVVPGGRFREIYYWDSYFTMQGLVHSEQAHLAKEMVNNFAWLIDNNGHIPNGNRSYYLSRSQPPFFAAMLALLQQHQLTTVGEFLPQLEKEYRFWMTGADQLTSAGQHLRVVKMPDGALLNRYYDALDTPRPESYREDMRTAAQARRADKKEVFRDLRAAAESGWDFSSRWFAPYGELPSIHTTNIIPVDLNSLLFNLEQELGRQHALLGNQGKAQEYLWLAEQRKQAIRRWLWDDMRGIYGDFSLKEQRLTGIASLATAYPLYFSIATEDQAAKIAHTLQRDFLKNGGLVTTLQATGEQWDYPNGWAPLQWLSIIGLRQYGHKELAASIAERWLFLNEKVFNSTGRMMEKYNVVDINAPAGGGEYPTQDGFGWTNGVVVGLRLLYPEGGNSTAD